MKIILLSLTSLVLVGCSTSKTTPDKFIDVQGVYTLPTLNRLRKAGSEPIDSMSSFDHFSYTPNSGNKFSEAVVILTWNARTGVLAEGVLLSVLFGAKAQSTMREYQVEFLDGKSYHIYNIETSHNSFRDVYFDATDYHELY